MVPASAFRLSLVVVAALTTAVFPAASALQAQRRTASTPSISRTVARTDSIVESIDAALPNFSKVEKELEDDDRGIREGSTLEAYFHRGAIRRIDALFYGEDSNSSESFYLLSGNLIFATDTRSSNTDNRSDEHRDKLYFANGKLIRWMDERGRLISLNTEEARAKQTAMLEAVASYHEAVRDETPAVFLDLIRTDSTDIPPGAYLPYSFKIPANTNCTLVGRVVATLGGNLDLELFVFNADDFVNFKAKRGIVTGMGVYESGRRAATTLDVPLAGPKSYTFVISNAFSTLTRKTIQGTARVRCLDESTP